jgi:DNA polymerase-3 subunit chi
MTDIAFHFNAPDKLAYVCRLLRKAVHAGAKLVVQADPDALQALDTQLWALSVTEFLPHCLWNAPAEQLAASPVVLVQNLSEVQNLPHRQVFVNLSDEVSSGFDAFERVIEVVSLDEADRQNARRRWKHYTDQGYAITRHDLKLKDTSP